MSTYRFAHPLKLAISNTLGSGEPVCSTVKTSCKIRCFPGNCTNLHVLTVAVLFAVLQFVACHESCCTSC